MWKKPTQNIYPSACFSFIQRISFNLATPLKQYFFFVALLLKRWVDSLVDSQLPLTLLFYLIFFITCHTDIVIVAVFCHFIFSCLSCAPFTNLNVYYSLKGVFLWICIKDKMKKKNSFVISVFLVFSLMYFLFLFGHQHCNVWVVGRQLFHFYFQQQVIFLFKKNKRKYNTDE